MLKPDFARLLDEADIAALEQVAARTVRDVGPRRDMIREGDPPRGFAIIIEGWACRYKALHDGRRQILSFLLPGDIAYMGWGNDSEADHSIASITPVQVAQIGRDDIDMLVDSRRPLRRMLRHAVFAEARMQREWLLNLGQRSAYERIAHLLCETFVRASGKIVRGGSVDFPLTQVDLADATGLTPVHVNRTLRALRRDRLIEIHSRTLQVPDLAALRAAGAFSDTYLPM
ncbi:Crp/Fnr family transcriptional regulator [Allosphingosinicella indica]|uniref:cAMP-binding domain of CRP or a regulatory subunit of cAMP-dependent protein kinases n=1 Tax=Allosphingosinicella indica TaxID=941907 RepID=A0A1X7G1X9_9SPHN|nr:Crp/Fnr family transcriptional regulator [Allosphingosinicella indica]SMF61883.1 cAMP-binding domain of CRP or a regulatory subunit of cAMP-dependent protein kinases [Allosphingosinicella indica]